MHYLFTDGEPNDASVARVEQLIANRNTRLNPLNFMSCTNQDQETEWMKTIEGKVPFTAELDDFASERTEVLKAQGPGFPFSKGFWLICQLAAPICPDDLDAMDENRPFSKQTMDSLMGRRLTPEEYGYYFNNNPNSRQYASLFSQFAREDVTAQQILNGGNSNMYNHQNVYSSTSTWNGNVSSSVGSNNYSSLGNQQVPPPYNSPYYSSNPSMGFWQSAPQVPHIPNTSYPYSNNFNPQNGRR